MQGAVQQRVAWRGLIGVALLAMQVLLGGATAVAAPTLEGWLPGPGAAGDNTYLGAIDAPSEAAAFGQPGTIRVSGWFVDRTARGWAGADDVEVFLGVMQNGGTLLAHAAFIQPRPDVAAFLGEPFWAAAGWSASVPTGALPPGTSMLSVYAHTPNKGWWYRPVLVRVGAGATSLAAPPAAGYDVSFPECGAAEPLLPAFAIVGVNGGRAFDPNPCLARQYAWAQTATTSAQPRVGFYLNTGNPGPVSMRWPKGLTWPRACDGSWSADCAYDYGWLYANDAAAKGRAVAGDAALLAPWWLDVEVENSWSEDKATNAASLRGAVDALRALHVGQIGIYTLASGWEEIVGATSATSPQNAPFSDLPTWRPGAQSAAETSSWCARTVTGGRVLFAQYPSGGFDANVVCP